MSNMAEKVIRDGSKTKRSKYNRISILAGSMLILIGVLCLILKGMTVEYIDAQGILHENFFLIPIGIACLFSGILTFLIVGIQRFFFRK